MTICGKRLLVTGCHKACTPWMTVVAMVQQEITSASVWKTPISTVTVLDIRADAAREMKKGVEPAMIFLVLLTEIRPIPIR